MDSSQRALHTNGKLFSNFVFLAENQNKISKEKRGLNINQIAMCYVSMDLSQRALQNNEKLFPNFKLVLEILANFGIIFRISYLF